MRFGDSCLGSFNKPVSALGCKGFIIRSLLLGTTSKLSYAFAWYTFPEGAGRELSRLETASPFVFRLSGTSRRIVAMGNGFAQSKHL
jgi:hypothetical protein